MKKNLIYCVFLVVCQIGLYAEVDSNHLLHKYEQVFSKLPAWEKSVAQIQPYGNGWTNQNYCLSVDREHYFIRVGSASRELFGLNTKNEYAGIQLAAELNLSPPVLLANFNEDILIMPLIESKQVNLHQKEYLAETVKLIKKLHESKKVLPFSAAPEEIISSYLAKIEELNISLTPLQKALIDARPRLSPEPLAPCHLDLQSPNVIDDGKRLWIVDWEYSAMSEPLFDVAVLASGEGFTDEEMEQLLNFYAGPPTEEMRERFYQLRILADMRWALWVLIQIQTSTLDVPFEPWLEILFHNIETRMIALK